MAMEKAFPRPKFDPSLPFVVTKPILLSGKAINPGPEAFDTTLVSVRTLRQLYEGRYLAVDPDRFKGMPQRPTVIAKAEPVVTAKDVAAATVPVPEAQPEEPDLDTVNVRPRKSGKQSRVAV